MINGVLAGRYRIEEALGEGGMSRVYRATDLRLNRAVAAKVLREELRRDAELVERFMREARTAASLSHPNIVNIFDVGQDGDQAFIIMELIGGQALRDYIRSDAPFEPADVVTVLDQLCDALDYAHSRGIVHRDVKPENVLIAVDGRVKIGDFGIARSISASTVTTDGTILGSAYYLSPEQAQGRPAAAASDIYSAGIIAYEMLTGRVPFNGDSAVAVATRHVEAQPLPPSRVNRKLPRPIDAAILTALAKDPRRRYASAMGLADAVASAIQAATPAPGVGLTDPLAATMPMPAVRSGGPAVAIPTPVQTMAMHASAGPSVVAPGGGARPRRRVARYLTGLLAAVVGVGFVLAAFMVGAQAMNNLPKLPAFQPPPLGRAGANGGRGSLGIANLPTSTATPTGSATASATQTETGTITETPTIGETPTITLTASITSTPPPEGTPTEVPTAPPPTSTPAPRATATPVAPAVGPGQVLVPSVVGLTEEDAQKAIRDAGLATAKPNNQPYTAQPIGHVLSQQPPAGTVAAKGSTVNIAVRR